MKCDLLTAKQTNVFFLKTIYVPNRPTAKAYIVDSAISDP